MSVLEDFVKDLLREKIIINYQAERNRVREFYVQKYRGLGKCCFHDFNWKLWEGWYIESFTNKKIYFDQRWIDYFVVEVGGNRVNSKPFQEEAYVDGRKCLICNIIFANGISRETHLKSLHHQIRTQFLNDPQFYFTGKDLKFEIVLQNTTSSGKLLKLEVPTKIDINACLRIQNASSKMINIMDIIPVNSLIPDITIKAKFDHGVLLEPSGMAEVDIHAYFEHSVHFIFPIVVVTSAKGTDENIFNLVQLDTEVTSEFSELHSKSKYVNNIPKILSAVYEATDDIIPGTSPAPYVSHYKETLPLKNFGIPQNLDQKFKELINVHPQFVVRDTTAPVIPFSIFCSSLDIKCPTNIKENYHSNLEILLHVEENQLKIDVRDYDMQAPLEVVKGTNRLYRLEVPGLAEARPSLLRGDKVYLKEQNNSRKKFEGIVHKVQETEVHLGLNNRFDKIFLPKKKFYIQFSFNRRTIRVEKQALNLAIQHNIIPSLYPEQIEMALLSHVPITINYFNVQLNEEQRSIVQNILRPKNIPFIIFGPPGTGKTVTIVESVYQLWRHYPNSRILICAPSNAATNEVAARLINTIPKSEMFRLLGSAYANEVKQMGDIKHIANIQQDGEFYMPCMDDLLKYRVVMTTIVTAARLVNGGVPNEHFTHVFIDESGYATETQTLIPIAGILSNVDTKGKLTGQIILAGDHRQLGPIVHSSFAKQCGYGTSLLERLITTSKLYSRNTSENSYDSRCVSKLVRNYRSHETILKLPSDLFYDKELIAVGNDMTNLFIGWKNLKNEDFPIIFHNVEGIDQRDKTSPSFFNVQEIEQVVEYLSKLFSTKVNGIKINQKHVGVITPYRKQVEKLKIACSKRNWNSLLIGSVEQFQGKERLVIVVSTVRSKNAHEFEEIDQKCQLGFVKSPKRFNVVLTRAKALLIVIGNAKVLKTDSNWSKFIKYCSENNAVAGKSFD